LFPEITVVIHGFDKRLHFRHGFVGIEHTQIDNVTRYNDTMHLKLRFQIVSAM
jgi:hypothetical protein